MYPERIRKYALSAIAGTPEVLEAVLHGVTDGEADSRPDPERFTIREVLCHLADWEPIWLERLSAIAEQEKPFLPGYDEGQFAIERDYAHSNTTEQADRFRTGRLALVEYVTNAPAEAWERTGTHGEIGTITFGELVFLLVAHDGYHLKQVVQYRRGKTA
jgi:uncharacterized damage-inducible protein DinB